MAQLRQKAATLPGPGEGPEQGGGGADGGMLKQVNPSEFAGAAQDESQGFDGMDSVLRGVTPPGAGTIEGAQSGESPRERGASATLRRPSAPSPMAGSTFQAGTPAPQGVMPFQPMDGADASMLAHPAGSLFGKAGGLQGGGLGLPLDPTSNQASDPIQLLMKLLGGQ